MNMFTNNRKAKKFIIVLVLLILFNFCNPLKANAFDFAGNVAGFFFFIESAAINLLNDTFCDEDNEFDLFSDDPQKQIVKFTPEAIIKGKFILFDANIFRDIGTYTADERYDRFDWLIKSSENSPDKGAKVALRENIAGWYYSLLNFSIVALLCVLVYVGIRMLTSTISQDKAKYKNMIKDWFVAMCLLICMHYIMIGTLNITSAITDAIGTEGEAGNQTSHIMSIIQGICSDENGNEDWFSNKECDEGYHGCRYHEDLDGDGKNDEHYTIMDAFKYEILLLLIVILTFLFAWKYLRRMFTIIFLILLGPVSCITYPIDKISDGKAQAFNKWLTEFTYNVLVQPFHLLVYLVLVGSAVDLANENLIYGIACLFMIIPAEKFVREMFGFRDKLGSPLGAFAGGALANQLLNKAKGSAAKSGGDDNSAPQKRLKSEKIDKDLISGNDGTNVNIDGDDSIGIEDNSINTEDSEENPINSADGTLDGEGDPINSGEETLDGEGDPINGGGQPRQLNEGSDSQDSNKPEHSGTDNSGDAPENTTREKRSLKSKAKGVVGKLVDRHSIRMANKYGDARRGQRWIKRGKKIGRGSLRAAGTLAGIAIGGMLGGTKGMVAGAALGSNLTDKAIDKVSNVGSDYIDALRSPEAQKEHAEKLALNDFMANKKQRDNAILNFRDKNGRDPSQAELKQDMIDRFKLSRLGLTDSQIDNAVKDYQKMRDETGNDKKALNQAAYAAMIADMHKGKFHKESENKERINSIMKDLGCNQSTAYDILNQAAGMSKETLNLPKETYKAPAQTIKTVLASRGIKDEQTITACQQYELDLSDIKVISELVEDDIEFKAKIDSIIGVHQMNNPQFKASKKVNKEQVESIKIEKGFEIKESDTNSSLRIDAIKAFESREKVTSKQRELAVKAVKGELSKNDKDAMTDKDKKFVKHYQDLLKANESKLKKEISSTNNV